MKLNGTATFMHILFYPWCIFLKNVLWRGNKRKGKNTALFFPGFRVVQWASLQYFHADALHVSTLFVIIAVIVLLSLSVISVPCWFESEISLDHYRGLALRGGGVMSNVGEVQLRIITDMRQIRETQKAPWRHRPYCRPLLPRSRNLSFTSISREWNYPVLQSHL